MPTFPKVTYFKMCTLVYQTVPSPFPHWELLKKKKSHKIKQKQLNISYLNTKAKQSSKDLIK